jgi:hypothetical protein
MFLAGLGSASLAVATGLAARPAVAANQAFGPGRLSGLPWHSGCSLSGISAFEAYRGRPCDGYTMWNLHKTWSDIPSFKGGWPTLRKLPGRLSIGLAPLPDNQSAVRNGGQWTAAARGAYDSVYTLFSQRLAASGRTNVIVRVGWEHNHTSPWFSGSNPQGYKDTFRRIVDVLRRYNPTVLIDWTNVKNGSKVGVLQTYPGDDWVDIIGVDYYDGWPAFNDEEIWDRQYNALSKGSPWGIGAWLAFAKSRTRGKTPGRPIPLSYFNESALRILGNRELNAARRRSSSNHERSLKPSDCHVTTGYWATRRNTWQRPQVASAEALKKRR